MRAIYVYNNNPVAVCPDSQKVIAGFMREDLFTVVHEIFLTDTTDYADIVLPATTQLEHYDVHKSYGHLYVLANSPAIAPLGEAKPNSEVFRLLAARMGFDRSLLQGLGRGHLPPGAGLVEPAHGRHRVECAEGAGLAAARRACAFRAVCRGQFPHALGQVRVLEPDGERPGHGSAAGVYRRRASRRRARRSWRKKYPLAFISPPARNFLNSSFANLPFALKEAGEPTLDIHPRDAAARGIAEGDAVRIFNARGSFIASARVSERARDGVVAALSVWWKKLSPDGRNANEVTSQAIADMGGAATYYDCLVEVERVGAHR